MLQLVIGLWQHGQRTLVALPLLALLGVYLLAGNHDRLSIYNNLQSFSKAQEARGMVIVGRFGKLAWPAVVVDREDGSDGVQFLTPDGQSHSYRGFSGPMKALTLRSGKGRDRFLSSFLPSARRRATRSNSPVADETAIKNPQTCGFFVQKQQVSVRRAGWRQTRLRCFPGI